MSWIVLVGEPLSYNQIFALLVYLLKSPVVNHWNVMLFTLKCLSIGTPKFINFLFVSNGKLMFFRCSNSQAHCNEAVLCPNFGTSENNEFSIWDKWKIYYF